MKLNKITETGFYTCDLKGRETIFEVIENTDEEWLKECPTHTLLIDEWILDHIDEENRKCYKIYHGNVIAVETAEDFDVDKITDTKYKMTDSYWLTMREDKPSRLEITNAKIKKLKIKNHNFKVDLEIKKLELKNALTTGVRAENKLEKIKELTLNEKNTIGCVNSNNNCKICERKDTCFGNKILQIIEESEE